MKVIEKDFLQIPYDDMENDGGIIVCLDPQKRLGEKTWAVVKTHSNKEAPPDALGLFWDIDEAISFANVRDMVKKFTHEDIVIKSSYTMKECMNVIINHHLLINDMSILAVAKDLKIGKSSLYRKINIKQRKSERRKINTNG